MINKKGGVEAPPSKLNCERRISRPSRKCQISFYDGVGVQLSVITPIVGERNIRGKRGAIKEWSKASRRRLREFMLTNSAPADWLTLGISFTVPGPALVVDETKRLWDKFRMLLKREEIGVIWRLEVQKRGAVHWHLIAICPKKIGYAPRLSLGGLGADIFSVSWFEALDSLGECEYPEHSYIDENGKEKIIPYQKGLRSRFKGARLSCVDIQENGNRGSWMRYLQDHTSKSKQEQLPVGFGRMWGHFGDKHFVKTAPESVVDMSEKSYFRFLRMFKRLCTPSYPDKLKPFGRALGYSPSRGKSGRSIWFSKPETVKRLQEWAMRADFEYGHVMGLNIYGRKLLPQPDELQEPLYEH